MIYVQAATFVQLDRSNDPVCVRTVAKANKTNTNERGKNKWNE